MTLLKKKIHCLENDFLLKVIFKVKKNPHIHTVEDCKEMSPTSSINMYKSVLSYHGAITQNSRGGSTVEQHHSNTQCTHDIPVPNSQPATEA